MHLCMQPHTHTYTHKLNIFNHTHISHITYTYIYNALSWYIISLSLDEWNSPEHTTRSLSSRNHASGSCTCSKSSFYPAIHWDLSEYWITYHTHTHTSAPHSSYLWMKTAPWFKLRPDGRCCSRMLSTNGWQLFLTDFVLQRQTAAVEPLRVGMQRWKRSGGNRGWTKNCWV